MGRKTLHEDGMQKTLSLRVTEKVATFLENMREALERTGERSASTSEVARQMLDRVVDQTLPLGFVLDKEEMLRSIVLKQRDELPLSKHEYAFLGSEAHAAYQKTSRDFVRADLLLNNLGAFGAYIDLRNTLTPHAVNADADRYFFGNLGSRAQQEKDLPAAVSRARDLIAEQGRPYRTTAEFMSRNLTVLSDESDLPDDAVDVALRPYLKGLLALSLRAFSYENDRPIDGVDDRYETLERLKIKTSLHHRSENYALHFLDGREEISLYIETTSRAWSLICGYLRMADLIGSLGLDRNVTSDYFRIEHSPMDRSHRLSDKESKVGLSAILTDVQMQELHQLFLGVLSEPEYQRVFTLLELRYGAI